MSKGKNETSIINDGFRVLSLEDSCIHLTFLHQKFLLEFERKLRIKDLYFFTNYLNFQNEKDSFWR